MSIHMARASARRLATACLLLAAGVCSAQPYLPWSDKSAGATLAGTLDAFRQIAATEPDAALELSKLRNRLAIVFVPGILGSSLTRADGKMIFGDLSEPSTLISRLALASNLIDESAESGIEANLLRSLGPVDLYGEAIDNIGRWATDNNVKLVTCGYDWRRDVRAGARDLDRCIARLDPIHTDLVIVAHSMGGLVSWTWATKQSRGEYAASRRVLQLAILGSPLRGSCEIIRMVQSGYIQPARADELVPRSDFKPLKFWTERFVDAFKNGISAELTQGIRPLVLTWPGAIELSPAAPSASDQLSCVGVPAPDDQPAGTPGTSYYDAAFWNLPAGKQMLRKGSGPDSYPLAASLPKVLEKAKDFRSQFKVEPLGSPAWLYYSRVWKVPAEAGYKAPYVSEQDQWTSAWGDGRVPYLSAMNSPDAHVFSHRMGVESVHGNLPGDPNFFDDYFGNRLPQALAAIWTTHMMQAAATRPSWIAGFAKLRSYGPDPTQLRTAMEPSGATGRESALLLQALESSARFNALLCEQRRDCAVTYASARTKVSSAAPALSVATALKQYSAVVRTVGVDAPSYAFAEGQRGLALARQLDWGAASSSLQKAELGLQDLKTKNLTLKKSEFDFADVVRRNLGKSLVESGQCKAAESYLKAAARDWPYAKEALGRPCNDVESGLQYCFDSGDFCRSK